MLALAWLLPVPAQHAAAQTTTVDARQVGPFTIEAAFNLTSLEPVLQELPALEVELRRVLAVRPCRQPVRVRLFADERSYRRHLTRHLPEAPYRRALFVRTDGRATIYAYRHADLATDLRHECTHALLHADLAVLPLWLDEGLAEYFELPIGKRAFNSPHLESLRWRLRLGFVRTIETLESKRELTDLTGRDYEFAWAWTHYLLHGPREATEELWGYLGAVRRGEPPGQLSARLERATPDLRRRLIAHFRQVDRMKEATEVATTPSKNPKTRR